MVTNNEAGGGMVSTGKSLKCSLMFSFKNEQEGGPILCSFTHQ